MLIKTLFLTCVSSQKLFLHQRKGWWQSPAQPHSPPLLLPSEVPEQVIDGNVFWYLSVQKSESYYLFN